MASIVIWDKLTQSTEDVYDTISSALRCWVQLPGVRDQLDIEVCSDLMVNELISMIPYIFFLYAMGEHDRAAESLGGWQHTELCDYGVSCSHCSSSTSCRCSTCSIGLMLSVSCFQREVTTPACCRHAMVALCWDSLGGALFATCCTATCGSFSAW